MKVRKYKSQKEVTISIKRYTIEWESAPSKGQQVLQNFLYPYWKNQIILAEMYVPGTKWRFDIVNCNKKIILEYSPSHHNSFNPFFHKNRAGYLKSLKSDIYKRDWAAINGFKVIDIDESDLDNLSINYFVDKFGISIV